MELAQGPGNLPILPDGRRIVSLHQFWTPERVLAEVRDSNQLVEFPAGGEGTIPVGLASVLGVRSDTAGVLYILDNGLAGKAPPKMVLWDTRANGHVRTIPLGSAADTNSLLQDWAFDYRRNQLYIADPAGGANAALVVVDLASGAARRVLAGDRSVVNEDSSLVVEGRQIIRRLPDGRLEQPKMGVDGIVIDYAKEWVYYGPFMGRTLYRVRAADLANPALSARDLAARVERYAGKPKNDGMMIDQAGNIYLGDVERDEIGVILASDRRYHALARSTQYKWVDDFEFGTDGMLYVVMTQLHLSPEFNAGRREPRPPFRVFRFRPLAPGRVGW
jgi:sugar lactone lactonase YvrE